MWTFHAACRSRGEGLFACLDAMMVVSKLWFCLPGPPSLPRDWFVQITALSLRWISPRGGLNIKGEALTKGFGANYVPSVAESVIPLLHDNSQASEERHKTMIDRLKSGHTIYYYQWAELRMCGFLDSPVCLPSIAGKLMGFLKITKMINEPPRRTLYPGSIRSAFQIFI